MEVTISAIVDDTNLHNLYDGIWSISTHVQVLIRKTMEKMEMNIAFLAFTKWRKSTTLNIKKKR